MTRILAYIGACLLMVSGMFLADYFHGSSLSSAVYLSIGLPFAFGGIILREYVYND